MPVTVDKIQHRIFPGKTRHRVYSTLYIVGMHHAHKFLTDQFADSVAQRIFPFRVQFPKVSLHIRDTEKVERGIEVPVQFFARPNKF